MDKRILLIILIIASISVHFAFFGHPNETVFDEVHFGKFISAYYTHQYSFDIHPPLGKLMIAGFGKLFNFQPEFSFAAIGDTFPDHGYLALRFLPTLAGTLLPIIIFFLALELGLKPLSSFVAGMLVALDTALLTQSRYILLDMFLLFAGFASLLFYFRYRNRGQIINLLWFGLLAGIATSIKWTGLTFLALAGIIEIVSIIKARAFGARRLASLVVYFAIIPFVLYLSVFVIHFSLLKNSGEGDAFMTPAFRATLAGTVEYNDPNIKPLNTWQKFIELNKEMYTANKTLTASHPYSSRWYTWPFMTRSIYYWNHTLPGTANDQEEKIYLIGNPLVWWGSTVALIYLIISWLGSLKSRIKNTNLDLPTIFILAYFLNLLPFIGIGRIMFLYHYFPALIFAILMLAYLVDQLEKPKKTVIALIAIAAVLFVYFAPLSYGLAESQKSFNHHLWLSSWL